MKKTPRKLVLHRETLRALDAVDLARAVGGSAAARPLAGTTDTHDAACPTLIVVGAVVV